MPENSGQNVEIMFDKKVVHEALKESLALEVNPKSDEQVVPREDQDTAISLLIHDVFGGEILKTRKNKGWHFYNRVDGERVDFTKSGRRNSSVEKFEDIPTTPDETYNYIVKEDYTTFFMRFIKAFEEIIGLDKYRTKFST